MQTRSVEDYMNEFEFISSQVAQLPKDQYLGYFIKGCNLRLGYVLACLTQF